MRAVAPNYHPSDKDLPCPHAIRFTPSFAAQVDDLPPEGEEVHRFLCEKVSFDSDAIERELNLVGGVIICHDHTLTDEVGLAIPFVNEHELAVRKIGG